MSDCVFCQIVEGNAPGSIVHQDQDVLVFLDIQPVNAGHLLVVPRQHAARMCDLDPAVASHMMAVAHRMMAAIRASSIASDGVNLFLADGEAAGQEVDHVHLHVIPRFKSDGFGFRFPEDYDTLPPRTELEITADIVRQALSTGDGDPMIHATLCFLVDGEPPRRILLGTKKRGFGLGKLNGIGGKLASGESPESGIVREVQEEIGVIISDDALRSVGTITFRFPFRPEFDHFVHVFVANAWEGEPIETEEIEPHWFPVTDIPYERMWQDDAYWLPLILNGKRIVASFEFGEDNESVTCWRIQGNEQG